MIIVVRGKGFSLQGAKLRNLQRTLWKGIFMQLFGDCLALPLIVPITVYHHYKICVLFLLQLLWLNIKTNNNNYRTRVNNFFGFSTALVRKRF